MSEENSLNHYKIIDTCNAQKLFIDVLRVNNLWSSKAYTRGHALKASGAFQEDLIHQLDGFQTNEEAGQAMIEYLKTKTAYADCFK